MDGCSGDSWTRDWSTQKLCKYGYFRDGDDCSWDCLSVWKAGEYCAYHYIWSDYDDSYCEDSCFSSDWAIDHLCNHVFYRDQDGCNGNCLRRWHVLRTCVHNYKLCGTCHVKLIDGEICACDECWISFYAVDIADRYD